MALSKLDKKKFTAYNMGITSHFKSNYRLVFVGDSLCASTAIFTMRVLNSSKTHLVGLYISQYLLPVVSRQVASFWNLVVRLGKAMKYVYKDVSSSSTCFTKLNSKKVGQQGLPCAPHNELQSCMVHEG